METIYIKEKDFIGYHVTENYPNEVFKEIKKDGKNFRVRIIKPDDVITIENVPDHDKNWYLTQKVSDSVKVISVFCSWFPKDLLVGVDGKFYSPFAELSKKTGWLRTSADVGSCQAYFLASKKQVIIDILKNNNFDNIKDLTI